jgi:hypothetical protein
LIALNFVIANYRYQGEDNIMENNRNTCSSIDETLSLIMVESSGDYELYNADVNILAAVLAGADIGHLLVIARSLISLGLLVMVTLSVLLG